MMLKRVLCLLFLLILPMSALGEEVPPVLVDRINAPAAHADFAFAPDSSLLEVIFPQILNCDAILLRCGGETMLVDCATQGQAVRIINMCRQLGITHIDRVVNTHPHSDHIGGFRDLIKEVSVDELWICYPPDANVHVGNAVAAAQRAGIPVKTFADGDVLTLGDATIKVWKLDLPLHQLNNGSAQLHITYGERTILLAADLQDEGQKQMVALHGEELRADILKYPHHGIEALRPEYKAAVSALFWVVTNNQRQTAGWSAIRRDTVPYAYTVPGFVCAFTDGATWLVHRIPSDIKY